MKHFRCAALAGIAYFSVGGNAGSVRRDPAHLRIAADNEGSLKAALEASISNLAVPAPVASAAQSKGAGEEKKEHKGDKGKKTDQPVQVQVPDSDMDHFLGQLSKECSGRFKQMLLGKGGDLHTFGTAEIKADEAGCKKLDGTFCATHAHIITAKKQTSNGRTMESTMDVSGNSCLPRQCMAKQDLSQLAQFMHTQAKSIVPGEEHNVELHVDCTKNGGSTATIGAPAKSGSTSALPTAVATAVVLALGGIAV